MAPFLGRLTVALVPVKGPDVGHVIAPGSGADPEIVARVAGETCIPPKVVVAEVSVLPGEGEYMVPVGSSAVPLSGIDCWTLVPLRLLLVSVTFSLKGDPGFCGANWTGTSHSWPAVRLVVPVQGLVSLASTKSVG